jgi:hypothetical protein
MSQPAEQEIARHLGEAIERLHEDMAAVELWAAALNCFVQPVPAYQPSDKFLLPLKGPRKDGDYPSARAAASNISPNSSSSSALMSLTATKPSPPNVQRRTLKP